MHNNAITFCQTGGRFTPDEATPHSNYLQLLAVLYGLQACLDKQRNVQVLVKSDNTIAAVANLNHMGGGGGGGGVAKLLIVTSSLELFGCGP